MIDMKEITINDMTSCENPQAISDGWGEGLWHKVVYETTDGVPGVMLFAEPGDKAAPLTYKLNAKGKYKIYVGLNYQRQHKVRVLVSQKVISIRIFLLSVLLVYVQAIPLIVTWVIYFNSTV